MEKKRVYHADRKGYLSKKVIGSIIEVCSIDNPYNSRLIFGEKLSVHGNEYINNFGVGFYYPGINISALWELFAEFVRRDSFSHLRSRYQAMFGFENKSDLVKFINSSPQSVHVQPLYIYELEVDNYIQRDMSSFDSIQIIPENPQTYIENMFVKKTYDYWNGEFTSNPVIETVIYDNAKIVNKYPYVVFERI